MYSSTLPPCQRVTQVGWSEVEIMWGAKWKKRMGPLSSFGNLNLRLENWTMGLQWSLKPSMDGVARVIMLVTLGRGGRVSGWFLERLGHSFVPVFQGKKGSHPYNWETLSAWLMNPIQRWGRSPLVWSRSKIRSLPMILVFARSKIKINIYLPWKHVEEEHVIDKISAVLERNPNICVLV